jgi:hypothetical protein
MAREERDRLRLRLLMVIFCLIGAWVIILGMFFGDDRAIVLGVFVLGVPLLLSIGLFLIRSAQDDYWVIEPSASHRELGGPSTDRDGVIDEGPGTCPTCGGTLFYGRVNCPHCSESIFQTEDDARPPEI